MAEITDDIISVLDIELENREAWRKSAWTEADRINQLEYLQSFLKGEIDDTK